MIPSGRTNGPGACARRARGLRHDGRRPRWRVARLPRNRHLADRQRDRLGGARSPGLSGLGTGRLRPVRGERRPTMPPAGWRSAPSPATAWSKRPARLALGAGVTAEERRALEDWSGRLAGGLEIDGGYTGAEFTPVQTQRGVGRLRPPPRHQPAGRAGRRQIDRQQRDPRVARRQRRRRPTPDQAQHHQMEQVDLVAEPTTGGQRAQGPGMRPDAVARPAAARPCRTPSRSCPAHCSGRWARPGTARHGRADDRAHGRTSATANGRAAPARQRSSPWRWRRSRPHSHTDTPRPRPGWPGGTAAPRR